MLHWTPRRIVAQVKLCVLALMIQRAAEIATGTPWSQLADVLERLKAVRYTAGGETIVQASRSAAAVALPGRTPLTVSLGIHLDGADFRETACDRRPGSDRWRPRLWSALSERRALQRRPRGRQAFALQMRFLQREHEVRASTLAAVLSSMNTFAWPRLGACVPRATTERNRNGCGSGGRVRRQFLVTHGRKHMEPTTWALVIALWVHPGPEARPEWMRGADEVWLKLGIGGLSEYECRRNQYLASREARAGEDPRFELRSISCESYPSFEKIVFE
jgi:hypothetical protein